MILGLTPAAPAMPELSLPSTAKSLTNMDNQPPKAQNSKDIIYPIYTTNSETQ